MKVITTIKDMQQEMKKEKQLGHSIGFVPTMGYLHEGHATLLGAARTENEVVVLSIFVNPTQFGPNEDFDTYPRDFERDERVAKEANVDYLFYPSVEEMYKSSRSVAITVTDRVDVLCGQKRPGHFDGVATVLTKLFHIVTPDRAYFGKKDAQQVAVVDGLIEDFNFPVELRAVDTVREADGLAKSSRNVYLTDKEREEAPVLFKSLQTALQLLESGEKHVEILKGTIRKEIEQHTSGKVDYIDVYTYPELKTIKQAAGKIIIALAVQFSKARLIDNVIVDVQGDN
ncbi:pantoate--beta-alanine ligase [Priestia megaterium]|jgi:pantoate--beta-alanine ligase|uniref:Pantothenate synthetase n=2 Tax=Priestia megaterium TaxID=1404 RepID=A0A6M6DYE8_PRIMG|nr:MULTISPECIES: pantoate--beta-alanine ligase [Priestia]AJI20264.1 pantoate--beta-alanine ligase [Priestia megaterium NBRC 15308 = ATCC 14581]KFM97272.1 pantoate--beta-alanine ligase [Priestia megaterium]KGJ86365.1 pantoate--beta-alanine ligase [Priestia megaterium NBRC 15308 = ATCC 14581]MBU8752587.1 pantoate--beta-alanine ligase [Priestia megaterium]MCU7709908.1 pantoate--beta-alanine ligase [Priestia megaterium]